MPAALQTACAYAGWYLDLPESMLVAIGQRRRKSTGAPAASIWKLGETKE
ncbi:MAG: hypothetical protein QOD95_1320 [Gammaproteobacteria bacterium]|jgi:hypothetical protein|nr:hypothetical protein [Gammaproteobacteria bacterium]